MHMLRVFIACVTLLSLTGCGARTILREPTGDGGAPIGDVPVGDTPFTPDLPDPRDLPFPPDEVLPDVPFPPDRFVFPDVPFPPDRFVFPDVPFPPDVMVPGQRCGAPIELPPTGVFPGLSTEGAVETYERCTMVPATQALFYATTVPAGQTLRIVTRPDDPDVVVVPTVISDCASRACVGAPFPVDEATRSVGAEFANTGAGPRRVFFVIGAFPPGAVGRFTLTLSLMGAASNARCATATPLMPGVTVSGQTPTTSGEVPSSCAGEPVPPSSALWYRVRVPAGQSLSVTATTSTPSRGVQLRVQRACSAACAAASPFSVDGRTTTARWVNTGADAEVFVAASGDGLGGTFDILATLRAAPTNTSCARATAVTDGTVIRAEDPSIATEVQANCPGMSGSPTPSLFYAATVPAGQILGVSVTPSGAVMSSPPVIRVVPSCGSTVCLAASLPFGGTSSSTSYTNTTGAAQRVIIAVGSPPGFPTSLYDLAVRIRPPATNGRCASPTRVVDGTVLRGENLSDAADTPTACPSTGGRDGPALYYVARVNAGERVSVLATPTGGAQVRLRVFDRCGATTCLSSSPEFGGAPATATYTNTGAAAQDVLIALDALIPTPGDVQAEVTFRIGRPPYTMTTITAACDDMSTATVATALTGDDVGEASRALPFAFRYFGEGVRAWAGSTNGFVQLFPMGGMSLGALGGAELPSPMAPLGMVAPFWDDLWLTAPSVVRWRDVASPRHLTVEWSNVQFCCGGMGVDRLTFQAKLFETTNVIEFHYCALSGTDRVFGSAASIGIQDTSGLQGLSFAARRAGAVRGGVGVRFTP